MSDIRELQKELRPKLMVQNGKEAATQLAAKGNLLGRPMSEFLPILGEPRKVVYRDDGKQGVVWLLPGYAVTLLFEGDTCQGVLYENLESSNPAVAATTTPLISKQPAKSNGFLIGVIAMSLLVALCCSGALCAGPSKTDGQLLDDYRSDRLDRDRLRQEQLDREDENRARDDLLRQGKSPEETEETMRILRGARDALQKSDK